MRRAGFTLFELVCVIVILGVLGAVAAPRFLDLSDEAARASVERHARSFANAVQFVRIVYDLEGRSGQVDDLPGFGGGDVDTNANGYPTDTANANTIPSNPTGANRCRNVFNGILTAPAPVCGGTLACTSAHVFQAAAIAAQNCEFLYIKDPSPQRFLTYDATNGVVTVTNP